MKALIVDDDPDLLDMVSMMLRHNGIEAERLSHAAPFFQTVETFLPDVIVMDVYLGDGDGRELCRRLKEHHQHASIPILLYSAGTITDSSIADSRADKFMPKPFDMQKLISNIRQLAEGKPGV